MKPEDLMNINVPPHVKHKRHLLSAAKQWMKENRVGLDVPEWQSRHPDWRKVTDVARTFDLIAPNWRGQIREAA